MTLNPKKDTSIGLQRCGYLDRTQYDRFIFNSLWYGYAEFFFKKNPLKITLSLQNPCSSSPCLPNATCLNGFTDKRYICLCQVGSKGKQCGEKGDQKLRVSQNKCQVYLHACVLLLLWIFYFDTSRDPLHFYHYYYNYYYFIFCLFHLQYSWLVSVVWWID